MRIQSVYSRAKKDLNSSLSIDNIQKIINELQTIGKFQNVSELIIQYYERLNSVGSIEIKLEIERKEIRYKELVKKLTYCKSIADFERAVKDLKTLDGYKDSSFIIEKLQSTN